MEGEGVPIWRVMPVMTWVFPIVVREEPWELRVRMEGWRFVWRVVWWGLESGLVFDDVNFDR